MQSPLRIVFRNRRFIICFRIPKSAVAAAVVLCFSSLFFSLYLWPYANRAEVKVISAYYTSAVENNSWKYVRNARPMIFWECSLSYYDGLNDGFLTFDRHNNSNNRTEAMLVVGEEKYALWIPGVFEFFVIDSNRQP